MSFADRIRALMHKPPQPREQAERPTDLGKLARAAVRAKRSRCRHPSVRLEPSGREVCNDCGDRFPCGGDACEHLDCIELGVALGLRGGFPRAYSHQLIVLNRGHRSGDDCPGCSVAPEDHYAYLVDPSLPPEAWVTDFRLEAAPRRTKGGAK